MATYYATGTASVTNGATSVTGSGTDWVTNGVQAGDYFAANGLRTRIASVNSATSITLATAWPGSTLSGNNYEIQFTPVATRVLAQVNTLLASLGNGIITALAGVSSAADKLPYFTGAATMSVIDFKSWARSFLSASSLANGLTSLGLGTGSVPQFLRLLVNSGSSGGSAVGGFNLLTIENSTDTGMSILTPSSNIGSIAFGDESNGAIGRIRYNHASDAMTFQTNAAERMRLTSAGRLGLGTSSPVVEIDVRGAIGVRPNSAASWTAPVDGLSIISDVATADNSEPMIALMSDRSDQYATIDCYRGASSAQIGIAFSTSSGSGPTEALRIDPSTGGILPGTDNAQDLGSTGKRWDDVYATNATIQTSDGRRKKNIVDIPYGLDLINALRAVSYKWKDEASPEVTETRTRKVQVYEDVQQSVERIEEVDGKWVKRIVGETVRQPVFDEVPLYNANGTPAMETVQKMDASGKAMFDKDGKPLTEQVQRTHQVPRMEDVTEDVVVRPAVSRSHSRKHFGLIAQEVKAMMDEHGISAEDFAAFIYNPETDTYGMRYGELIPVLIKACQDLSARCDALQAQLDA